MRVLAEITTVLLLAGSGSASWAGVRLTAEATPSARRPIARIVFGVTLENDASPQSGTLVVEQLGVGATRSVELPLQLAANARKHLLVAFDTRPGGQDFELRFEAESELLAAALLRVPSVGRCGELVGVLGPVPGWLRRQADSELRAVELIPNLLPSDARTWPTVDTILWPDPRTGDLDEPTAAALRDWVRSGGRLLAGTAADQPRAMEELGFETWGAPGRHFERVGLGMAGHSELDLARREAGAGLNLRSDVPPLDSGRWWLPAESLFETVTTSMMRDSRSTPEAPVWSVGWILGIFLLLSGPGEWLAHRRAIKSGRRPAFAALRRPALLVITVGAVLVLVEGFANEGVEAVRIDVIDVDLESGAARGRAYVALRRSSGGWMQLEVPSGTHLSAGLGSRSVADQWSGDAYEPPRLQRASLHPDATHRSVRYLPAQWSTVTWRVSYEPDSALVEAARAQARRGTVGANERIVRPARVDGALSADEQAMLHLSVYSEAQHCWQVEDARSLADCIAASCEALHGVQARRRGMRQLDMEWPNGAPAWISVREEASGPDLQLAGDTLPGRRFTVYRVLLPEDPS